MLRLWGGGMWHLSLGEQLCFVPPSKKESLDLLFTNHFFVLEGMHSPLQGGVLMPFGLHSDE